MGVSVTATDLITLCSGGRSREDGGLDGRAHRHGLSKNGWLLNRGGGPNRWQARANCPHGDSSRRRFGQAHLVGVDGAARLSLEVRPDQLLRGRDARRSMIESQWVSLPLPCADEL